MFYPWKVKLERLSPLDVPFQALPMRALVLIPGDWV